MKIARVEKNIQKAIDNISKVVNDLNLGTKIDRKKNKLESLGMLDRANICQS